MNKKTQKEYRDCIDAFLDSHARSNGVEGKDVIALTKFAENLFETHRYCTTHKGWVNNKRMLSDNQCITCREEQNSRSKAQQKKYKDAYYERQKNLRGIPQPTNPA